MLVEYASAPAFKTLIDCIYAVVFFGPPHRGLEVQSLEQLTRGKETHGLITDLEKGSTLLRELNEKFPNVSKNIKIVTCFELQATPTTQSRHDDSESWERTGPTKMMVDQNSACLYTANEIRIAIDSNHSKIAKLSRADEAYQRIRTFFEDNMSVAQATIKTRVHQYNAMQAIERIRKVNGSLAGFLDHLGPREGDHDTAGLKSATLFLDQIYNFLSAELFPMIQTNPVSLSRLMESIFNTLQTFEDHVLPYKDVSTVYEHFVANGSLNHLDKASCEKFARGIEKSDRFASQLGTARISKLMKNSSSCIEKLRRILWLTLFSAGRADDFGRLENIESQGQTDISLSMRRQIRAHVAASKEQSIQPLAGHLEEGILFVVPRVQNFVPQGSTECFPVVVEERHYVINEEAKSSVAANEIKLKLEAKLKARMKIEQLTAVLQHLASDLEDAERPVTPPSSSVNTLRCLGYQETAEPGKFLILFRVPNSVDLCPIKNMTTLYTKLNSKEFRTTLEQRFRLAKTICSSILHLHCWGWVHKDIRPENIILINNLDDSRADLDLLVDNTFVAHLGGFEIARPQNDFSDATKTLELQKNLYRHPQRQQTPSRPFTKTDDLYAIGVILLEIGIQRSVDSIFMSKIIAALEKTGYMPPPEVIAGKIKKLAASELPAKMGSRYAEAVRKCLTGDFGITQDDEMKSELSIAFQNTVLDELEIGCQL